MNQKSQKQIFHWLKVAVIGITLGFALQFVRAWTEPSAAPPGGNIGAPINTGSNTQTKAGVLGVGGLWAPSLNDSNNGNFYLDPNTSSSLNDLSTNNILNSGNIMNHGGIFSYGDICTDISGSWKCLSAGAPPCTCVEDPWGSGNASGINYTEYCPWGSWLAASYFVWAGLSGGGQGDGYVSYPCY